MPPSIPPIVARLVRQCLPGLPGVTEARAVGGGSINASYWITCGRQAFFCKVNSATKFPHLFEREAHGLDTLRRHGIRTPEVAGLLSDGAEQALLLEWIEPGERTPAFWQALGQQLAALHAVTDSRFGFEEDNYMGSVPQSNAQAEDWVTFFTEARLRPMVERCLQAGLVTASHAIAFQKLYERLPAVFDAADRPALLHGDLWSGNFMCTGNAAPVLIDPAVYFGHPSADLAMTTLFGGFDAAFYKSYRYHASLPDHYNEQWEVCNLYPLLIHLLLFGPSYLPRIAGTLQRFS